MDSWERWEIGFGAHYKFDSYSLYVQYRHPFEATTCMLAQKP